jgi:hypothetical protein
MRFWVATRGSWWQSDFGLLSVVSGLETLEPFALPVGGLGRTESCVDGHQ